MNILNDAPHKKSILNFNVHEWAVDAPVARMKPVVPQTAKSTSVSSGFSINSVDVIKKRDDSTSVINAQKDVTQKNKKRRPIVIAFLIMIVVSVVLVLTCFLHECEDCKNYYIGKIGSYYDSDTFDTLSLCDTCITTRIIHNQFSNEATTVEDDYVDDYDYVDEF